MGASEDIFEHFFLPQQVLASAEIERVRTGRFDVGLLHDAELVYSALLTLVEGTEDATALYLLAGAYAFRHLLAQLDRLCC